MRKLVSLLFVSAFFMTCSGQKIETIYLDKIDSTINRYTVVIPEQVPVKGFLCLLDGFGGQDILQQTDLPLYAARQGIFTIMPVLKTGVTSFAVDSVSQQSLKNLIGDAAARYHLQGKDFFIGGFSIGGSGAVKYAELAIRDQYPFKPKAVFGVDPPLDFERYYHAAKRVIRMTAADQLNPEVSYMVDRIEREMGGTPESALERYYNISPYSASDTMQKAVKLLAHTPIMLIVEPDIQWWLTQRGYDYSFMNVSDHAGMINELRHLGNTRAMLVTTVDKGYRKPNHTRHPHSWSIAEPGEVVNWLLSQ